MGGRDRDLARWKEQVGPSLPDKQMIRDTTGLKL